MKNGQISVVVPCFNEEKTIFNNIKRIADYLEPRFECWEIIAVNDGSADRTGQELLKVKKETRIKIIDNAKNQGKGGAVRRGILSCHHDTVMFLDADLGIPIEELEKFFIEIKSGYDIVIASRFVPGLKIVRPVRWHRKIMEKVFRIMRMIVINDWNVKDTQCGFKVFKRGVAMKIFSKATVERFAFDAELIFIANKLKYKIKELPISLQNPPNSHVRIIRDPLNMMWDLLRIKMNDWRGKYK
jgi:dolichyl-phosphate beta-glucosyltransferase